MEASITARIAALQEMNFGELRGEFEKVLGQPSLSRNRKVLVKRIAERIQAEAAGHTALRRYDVGVAGLHRVTALRDELNACGCVIVVAGMEEALPSVVAGPIFRPVVAVPTSVGYGVALGGLAALLGMLSSCAPGVTVVNIDNGFGAALAACRINTLPLRDAGDM